MDWTAGPDFDLQVTSELGSDAAASSSVVVVGMYGPPKPEEGEEKEGVDEGEKPLPDLAGLAASLDAELDGAIGALLVENRKDFKDGSATGSSLPVLRVVQNGMMRRIIVVGLGPAGASEEDAAASNGKLGAALAKVLKDEKAVESMVVSLPEGGSYDLVRISEQLYSGLYVDNRFRSGEKVVDVAKDLKTVTLVLPGTSEEIEKGAALALGVGMCKDIVNAPPNILNPKSLADTAQQIAESSDGTITCKILGVQECEKRGMGSYLAVGRGAEVEPHFIHLTYKPKSGDVKRKVGIVGKGVTFDAGGYNIKTQMMELMKFDCGGSAAVLGAARTVAVSHPEGVEVHFIVAACENLINGRAYRPSDVLVASNGKTIEVLNTDAEGRLTMADALVYADREVGAEKIVELSTLTGACMVALGDKLSGMWTHDDDLAAELEASSKASGDKTWRMPLPAEYEDQLKSKIADIQNLGGKYGGAITAALFLNHFVDKKKPFAHVDIAGPVWDATTGATGHGVKLLAGWIEKQGKE